MVEPRGQVSRFGGREVHWRLREGQGPTVVLMAGCGLAMEFWADVAAGLGGRRVLAFDRPGLGGTRWPGHLPRLDEEVATLTELLEGHGDGPAVLVAHSMAAFHAEAVARTRPDLVAALVLVDPSVEWYAADPGKSSLGWARGMGVLARSGFGRPLALGWRFGTFLQSYREWSRLGRGRLDAIYRDADSWEMATAESLGYERQAWDLQELRAERPLPGLPVSVLSAADASAGSAVADQARLCRLLNGRQLVVEGSRHLMMLDRPDAVVSAVGGIAGADDAHHSGCAD